MKINPVGINTYQNLTNQGNTTEKQLDGSSSIRQSPAVTTEAQTSRLAIKAPSGSYADLLSTEEKQALEVLFNRFKDNTRFGATYQTKTETAAKESTLGRIIDIKV